MVDLETTKLWQAFYGKATDAQREMVRKLTKRAADRLDLVRDTFPTYTLHNRTHAINVIERIGDLLGPDTEKIGERITALEGAILILSAYCHDIGMVFDEEQRQNIQHEESFTRFVGKYAEARIAVERAGEVPVDVAEWYCRWIHPDRVFGFLKTLPKEESYWGQIPLQEKLGAVCRSHGYDASELLDDKEYPTDFLGQADLRFCAILLRLGDILDFDNTRAPEEVYSYLGIGKRKTRRAEASDVEWRKHLAAGGFSFPSDRAEGRYELRFAANPDHPAVEYDVRQFLNVIHREIQQCDSVLKYCSKRWRDFKLPMSINSDDVVSLGYKYGEYRFSLEQNRILELLMGENLYDDPYAFVRELIQNAIDTTRHRVYFERSKGSADYEPHPIVVSTWSDRDNYQWVRVDDYGMGMNEDIILKYFLKIGESYYKSAQFSAEMLSYAKRNETRFVPISRFGIGVLSCFILGDKVEISTRYVGDGKSDPYSIRMGLSGLHSFYVLQSERDAHYDAAGMPGLTLEQQVSYREAGNYGTSVAVRLDPQKEKTKLDLKEVLEKYVLFSPVPIMFEGELMGGDLKALIETPWANSIVEEELTDDEMARIEAKLAIKFDDKITLRVVPLDLTKHSPTPNLKGQALLGYLLFSESDSRMIEEGAGTGLFALEFSFDENEGPLINVLHRRDPEFDRRLEAEILAIRSKQEKLIERQSQSISDEDLHSLREEVENLEERVLRKQQRMGGKIDIDLTRVLLKLEKALRDSSSYKLGNTMHWLSHNGITVPTQFPFSGRDDDIYFLDEYVLYLSGNSYSAKYWLRQAISLSDALRPDVSLSRSQLRNLSWGIYSAITLTFRKALRSYTSESLPMDDANLFERIFGSEHFILGDILTDPLMSTEGEWAKQNIIDTNYGPESLQGIQAGLRDGLLFEINDLPSISNFFHESFDLNVVNVCAASMVQIGLKIRLLVDADGVPTVIASLGDPLVAQGQHLFPPLFFIPYEGSGVLRFEENPLNQNHPLSIWLIEHAETINKKYPGLFKAIRERASAVLRDKVALENNIRELNIILDRLWELEVTLRPAKQIHLSISDFEAPYSW